MEESKRVPLLSMAMRIRKSRSAMLRRARPWVWPRWRSAGVPGKPGTSTGCPSDNSRVCEAFSCSIEKRRYRTHPSRVLRRAGRLPGNAHPCRWVSRHCLPSTRVSLPIGLGSRSYPAGSRPMVEAADPRLRYPKRYRCRYRKLGRKIKPSRSQGRSNLHDLASGDRARRTRVVAKVRFLGSWRAEDP